jgi:dihydrofolate synthase/folylpolyglutamate synthase
MKIDSVPRQNPLEFLLGLEVLGMKFGLENMNTLCSALDHPERSFQSAIVAGTNGKGSVTAMLSAALHAAGHRVARYTSPHLQRLEERFVIQEQEVATNDLMAAAAAIQVTVERLVRQGGLASLPTFFECTTATAFELFRRAKVDVAVLEVGLGGRLDATNVVSPLVAAITSIDLDHQAQLGNTLREVAREKAGVIKTGIPVVSGPVPAEADEVIARVCAERGARLVRVGEDVRVQSSFDSGETAVTIETPHRRLSNLRLSLRGRHQATNAATAVAVLDELRLQKIDVDDAAVRAGLRETQWPGRLERFDWRGREILLDSAHNPAGARALADYLEEAGWTGATLLFGAMRDKDVNGMLSVLLPLCNALVCTTPANPRALPSKDVAALASALPSRPAQIEAVDDPEAALVRASELGRAVVAAGSIFLIGPLRGILR